MPHFAEVFLSLRSSRSTIDPFREFQICVSSLFLCLRHHPLKHSDASLRCHQPEQFPRLQRTTKVCALPVECVSQSDLCHYVILVCSHSHQGNHPGLTISRTIIKLIARNLFDRLIQTVRRAAGLVAGNPLDSSVDLSIIRVRCVAVLIGHIPLHESAHLVILLQHAVAESPLRTPTRRCGEGVLSLQNSAAVIVGVVGVHFATRKSSGRNNILIQICQRVISTSRVLALSSPENLVRFHSGGINAALAGNEIQIFLCSFGIPSLCRALVISPSFPDHLLQISVRDVTASAVLATVLGSENAFAVAAVIVLLFRDDFRFFDYPIMLFIVFSNCGL